MVLKDNSLKDDAVFLNHERIHLRQQSELLVLFFYVWYGLEFMVRLLQYRNKFMAYKNISFEREAYRYETDLSYLKSRRIFGFLRFM